MPKAPKKETRSNGARNDPTDPQSGKLHAVFSPADVNAALGIHWAGTFLPKHRVGNPGGFTELFVRVEKGRYQLT
jgi:hypothetical protein